MSLAQILLGTPTKTYVRDFEDNSTAGLTFFGGTGAQSCSGGVYQISRPSGSGQGKSRLDLSPSFVNGSIRSRIYVPTGSFQSVGFVFRTTYWGNGDDTEAYILAVQNDGALVFGKGTNNATGGFTSIRSLASAVATGTYYVLGMDMNGSSFTASLNGTAQFTQTDSSYSAAGQVGFAGYGSSTLLLQADNIVIVPS